MTTNPEKHVLDAIDELVNEQLAGGPVDDYNVNRYPRCRCGHDWHGVRCELCGCQQSEGEAPVLWTDGQFRRELDVSVLLDDENGVPYSELEEEWRRREGAIVAGMQGAPWVVYHPEGYPGGGGGRSIPDGFVPLGISDEEADQLDAVAGEFSRTTIHIHHLDAEGICVGEGVCPEQQQPPRGYTIADLRAMRGREWRPQRYVQQVSAVRHDYPQRFILGQGQDYPGQYTRPRVRFWRYLAEEARFWLIEGRAEVMHITWRRDGVSVEVRLEDYGELVVDEEDTHLRPASTPIPPGMIAMEGFETEGGFTTVGYLHPDDLTIDHNQERVYAFGEPTGLVQEEYRVTMRIPDNRVEPLRELLERGQ